MTLLSRNRIVSLSKLTLTRHSPLTFQPLLFSSSAKTSVPTVYFLTTQHRISPETALKVSATISHLKNLNRTDSILSFLQQTGFSAPQIDLMINKYPGIINANPEIVKEKLSIFQEKGFSTQDTIHIVSEIPRLLCRTSGYRIGQSITALKSVLGSTDAMSKVSKRLSYFLDRDLGKTMIPNIEFLKKRSELSSSQMAQYVIWFPMLFLHQPKTIVDGARRLDEMGLKWSSKTYLHALKVVSLVSEEKLKLKMSFFQGLGFSENEVLRMFERCPYVFGCAEKNIKETMEVLLGSGRNDQLQFLKNPELLMYSLEKRIKPRVEVVKVLEDKGLFPKKLGWPSILKMTNNKFVERFVFSNSNALGHDCVKGITKKLALHQ